ncbi:MAG: hypothetical protein ACI4JC_02270 [Faecalibacterium sp.]
MRTLDRLYIKAQVGFGMAKTEFQKLREEDEGLDIIITIILVAVGLILVGVVATFATNYISEAQSASSAASTNLDGLKTTAGIK